jgi:glycosyltransferase involved in cell wall biosynthesis
MDGLEWKRGQYSKNVQRFLKHAEKWAARYSDYLIADSKGIQQYLKEVYNKDSAFIAYGATLMTDADEKVLEEKGLKKYEYDLLIARMEPENNVEAVIEAHLLAKHAKPLILIGKYKDHQFGADLQKKYDSDRIRFWGPVFDLHLLNNLRYFSNLYFHGHSVGGTNPSLLEAMASYALIMAHDNVFNKSILEEDAFYFTSASDIAAVLDRQVDREEKRFMIENNADKIRNLYSWEHIINLLENYLLHVMETGRKK